MRSVDESGVRPLRGQNCEAGVPLEGCGRLSPENRALLERNVSRRVLEALNRGEGVVFYPENFNRLLADARTQLEEATGVSSRLFLPNPPPGEGEPA